MAVKVPSLVLIILLVDFATTGAAAAAGGCAAAGLAAGVTSLLCDQAPLIGSVMSADSNKIREMFMANSLNCID
jgi:hypothetical protein